MSSLVVSANIDSRSCHFTTRPHTACHRSSVRPPFLFPATDPPPTSQLIRVSPSPTGALLTTTSTTNRSPTTLPVYLSPVQLRWPISRQWAGGGQAARDAVNATRHGMSVPIRAASRRVVSRWPPSAHVSTYCFHRFATLWNRLNVPVVTLNFWRSRYFVAPLIVCNTSSRVRSTKPARGLRHRIALMHVSRTIRVTATCFHGNVCCRLQWSCNSACLLRY